MFKNKVFFVPMQLMDPNFFFLIAQTIVLHGGTVFPEPQRVVDYVVFNDFRYEVHCAASNATIKAYRRRLPLITADWIERSVKDGAPREVDGVDLKLWEDEIRANTASGLLRSFVDLASKLCPVADPYSCVSHVETDIRTEVEVHYPRLSPPITMKLFEILPAAQTPPAAHTPSETPSSPLLPASSVVPPPETSNDHPDAAISSHDDPVTISRHEADSCDNETITCTELSSESPARAEQDAQGMLQLEPAALSSSPSSCSTPVPANDTPTPSSPQGQYDTRDTSFETINTSFDTATSSEFEIIVAPPRPLRPRPMSTVQQQHAGIGLGMPPGLEVLPAVGYTERGSAEELEAIPEAGHEADRADLGGDTDDDGTATPIGTRSDLATMIDQLEEYVATYPNTPESVVPLLGPVPTITVTEPEESVGPEDPNVPAPPGRTSKEHVQPEASAMPTPTIRPPKKTKKEKRAAAKAAKLAKREAAAATINESARSTSTVFPVTSSSGHCPTCGRSPQSLPSVDTEAELARGGVPVLPVLSDTSPGPLTSAPASAPTTVPAEGTNEGSSPDVEADLDDSAPPSYSEASATQDHASAANGKEPKTKLQKRNQARRMKGKMKLKELKEEKARKEEADKARQKQREKEEKEEQERQRGEGVDYNIIFQLQPETNEDEYSSEPTCSCLEKVTRHACSLRQVCTGRQHALHDMLRNEENYAPAWALQTNRPCCPELGLRRPTLASIIALLKRGSMTRQIVDAYMVALDFDTHHFIALGNTDYFELLIDKEYFSNAIPSPVPFDTCDRFIFPMLFDTYWFACMADPVRRTLTLYDPACRSWTAPRDLEPLLLMIEKNLFSHLATSAPIKTFIITSPVRVDKSLSGLLVTQACELFAHSGPDESAHIAIEALGSLLTSTGKYESVKNTVESQLGGRFHNKNCIYRYEMFPLITSEDAPKLADQHPVSKYVEKKLAGMAGNANDGDPSANKPEYSYHIPPVVNKHFIPPSVLTCNMAQRLLARVAWTATTGYLA